MSRVPYLVEGRWGFKLGNQPLIDGMYRDGFLCPISKLIMGETAEILAEQYKISREEQDAFALESHQRAARAAAECHFKSEIVPVERADKKGNVTRLEKDEHVRADVTIEGLAKLPPVFSKTGASAPEIPAASRTAPRPWCSRARKKSASCGSSRSRESSMRRSQRSIRA